MPLVIAAAVVRAVHVTASARLTRGRGDSTLAVVLVQLTVCAMASSRRWPGPTSPARWAGSRYPGGGSVLFLGLLCSVFAFVVQLWAVRRTSADAGEHPDGHRTGVWALAVGVWSSAGKRWGSPGSPGPALIVAASYAGQAIERRHRRARAPRRPCPTPRSPKGRTALTSRRHPSTVRVGDAVSVSRAPPPRSAARCRAPRRTWTRDPPRPGRGAAAVGWEPCTASTRSRGGKLVVVDLEEREGRIHGFHLAGDFFLEPDDALDDDIDAAVNGLPVESDVPTIAAAIRAACLPEGAQLLGFTPESVATAIVRARS